MTPRNYLALSTIAGLFSGAAVVQAGVGVQLWYVVLASNLLLLTWLGAFSVRRGVVALGILLVLSGIIGYMQQTDNITQFSKQFLGIMVSVLYFSSFYRLVAEDVVKCFGWYVRAAYYVAWAGIVLVCLQLVAFGSFRRLQSVLPEPAAFAIATLPALHYCFNRYRAERAFKKEALVLLIALLLSRSSVGFLGLLFAVGLLFARSWKSVAFGLAIVALAGALFYQSSDDFRMRCDDTLRAAQDLSVDDANLSTFALASNAFVTSEVLAEHPLTGNGLGSHVLSHRRYISAVPGVEAFERMVLHDRNTMDELNAADASSLFLRILSELGIVGLILTALFIFHFRVTGGGAAGAVSNAILVYFFVKLLRAGHYFSPEQYFFVLGYCLNASSHSVRDSETAILRPATV